MPLTTDISAAARRLLEGGLVAFPTETVYGLGADARVAVAVARIFEEKQRPSFNPLIVHALDAEAAFRLASSVPPLARKLAAAFWPGPLTMVLPRADSLPAIVSAGLCTVALRVPNHPIARQLLEAFGGPIAAPSANRSTQLSPTRAEHVRASLSSEVMLLDGGAAALGVESTVVSVEGDVVRLLRRGALSEEELEAVVGPLVHSTEASGDKVASPGQLLRHYAPAHPLTLAIDPTPWAGKDVALLTLEPHAAASLFGRTEVLSESGDLREAAAVFFDVLHQLSRDTAIERIVAVPLPERGLGATLNDRLRRAAASSQH